MAIDNTMSGAQAEEALQIALDRGPARIKVVGVGGGGCNCVRRMLKTTVPGVKFVMVNTDIKSLEGADHDAELLQIGEKVTHGWGAGGDGRQGARAAEESSSADQASAERCRDGVHHRRHGRWHWDGRRTHGGGNGQGDGRPGRRCNYDPLQL